MAELAASVISIAHAVCMLIENTQKALKYIEEVKSINESIDNLLHKVKDLHRLIRTVESTCGQATPFLSSNSTSIRHVQRTLLTCKKLLESLKPVAYELAALDSTTWHQKYEVKQRLDRLKRKLQAHEEQMKWNIDQLNIGINCVSAELNTARRSSEVSYAHHPTALPVADHPAQDHDISPISRTLSEADTLFGPDPDLNLHQFPIANALFPRPSISSTRSQTSSIPCCRSDSVTSAVELSPLTSKNDWRDFEFHIMRCGSKQERVKEIRAILQRHRDGVALAQSKDDMKRTPLHSAALRGDVDLGRVLIAEYQADVNAKDAKPNSILDLAVANRHPDFVALLLDHGVNESTVSKKNETNFIRMKRTIKHKNRTLSQSSQRGSVT